MEKFPTNLEECGNISAASVPILLDNINKHGMICEGKNSFGRIWSRADMGRDGFGMVKAKKKQTGRSLHICERQSVLP